MLVIDEHVKVVYQYFMVGNYLESSPENILVLIAGPSGCGKSTVARNVAIVLPDIAVVHFDDFQFDPEVLEKDEEGLRNWDDPSFTDFNLAYSLLGRLKKGEPIQLRAKNEFDNPDYIHGDYRRKPIAVSPGRVCLVEGHYTLVDDRVVALADLTIYLSINFDISFGRRTKHSVKRYDQKYLLPMHENYVLPTQEKADVIVNIEGKSQEEVLKEVRKIIGGINA